ncbi:MAG: hypothetical protein LAP40_01110 [Acidobacteriia bacterium]|nr:hypothetical protein [Terriglobia bacterium]
MTVPSERRQFRILYRDFLFRMVDLELLSSQGDMQNLLGQFAALLGAFSFVLTVLIVPRYVGSRLPLPQLAVAAWGDEEFLISTTMAVVGIFAVIAWNAVLPDRRDSLVLGPLPVRARTIIAAKVAAMLTALGISVAAVNVFIGTVFPHLVGGGRTQLAYYATVACAGLFVFCSLLALQGLAAQVLSYRWGMRASAFLQMAAFFAILSVYFLTPPLASPRGLAAPENQRQLAWLPSFWFLGLFQELQGGARPVFQPLAARALTGLSGTFAVACMTYALTYYRHLRRVVEQPDIAPADRSRPATRFGSFAAAQLLPRPLDRALVLFTARTMARSRQHRLLLAAYGGVGLAIALAYAKELIYGSERAHWREVTLDGLIVSLVLLTFAVVGARAVFTLPIALPANWIFRITAVHSPEAYFAAVRKSLLALTAVPVCLISALAYLAIWPGRPAVEHVAVLVLTGILLVDLALYQFRKIPFACSYLPGGANLKVKLGVYAIAFLTAISAGTGIEFVSMRRLAGFAAFLTVLLAVTGWAWRRRMAFAAAPSNGVQFEDLAPADVTTLDLHGE